MSRFKPHNLFFLLLLVFLPAGFVSAKTLKFEDKTWDIVPGFGNFAPAVSVRSDFDLGQMVNNSIFGKPILTTEKLLSDETATQLSSLSAELTQSAKDAQMMITNQVATNFDPGQNGQALDLYETRKLLDSDLSEIELPVSVSLPQNPLAETNTLGINELVATGVSDFSGSPKNRLVNIRVGAQKFDGLIIAPGEEFSFNKYLGDVDDKHGFLPELVIKPEGVTPEFGGGLCQVSSTAFRAAMNAGLPITARRNHSFAVRYYAPQGTDATIYPGSADLKFVNNLSSSILIHTKIIGQKLYFEYYGTKDTRQVSFEGPTVYDQKPDGSMKATWTRHVLINGQTTTQVFKSTYLPPALFEHDATTVPAVPNPQTPPPTNT